MTAVSALIQELKKTSKTADAPSVKRVCMRDHIRDVLVARILDGTFAPGTQLKELSLAREFNVSQAPIREALRELEGSGLVTSERYRGTRVRGADSKEMRESYELRATTSLARLWRKQGKSADAAKALDEIYGWFTEGLETPDLKDARELEEIGTRG